MHRSVIRTAVRGFAAVALAAEVAASFAHVTLPAGGATAGTDYAAPFHVGHACAGSAATTGLRVRLPDGFVLSSAEPRAGWSLTSNAREVTWTASSATAALPSAERADFVVRGRLPAQPGTLWFKVLQTCDRGEVDWAEVPAEAGASAPAGRFPAARLDVLPPGVAAVDVRDAWARPVAAGQAVAGVYARLTAPAGARLVGATTPVAEATEVHEMRMEEDVMRMRRVDEGLALPPGQPVDLGPGGYHLMLTGLKRALVLGESFPLTLRFVDGRGQPAARDVNVHVQAAPAAASAAHMH